MKTHLKENPCFSMGYERPKPSFHNLIIFIITNLINDGITMKKVALTSYLLIISAITFAQTISNPTHVEQFEKTGICIGCDLSNLFSLNLESDGAIDLSNSNLIRTTFGLAGSNRQHSKFNNLKGFQLSMYFGDFSYSNFSNADLREAYLADNNLTSADFTGANLEGVNFTSANLYQAKITREQLNSVSSLCNAILPDGKEGEC
ncbi:TPA: pentapeptide repeat-containing protein [Legionella pneumophila]|nr:hypothetical protein [Legionella pneumophila subsp. pneumophila]HAU3504124.1 pentapeptide repeat-containing protein [Legionella pneumophila]